MAAAATSGQATYKTAAFEIVRVGGPNLFAGAKA